ncbi:MAG: hypothetical protein EBQ96_00515 [Proteobacteria bacterium]|nr:hypothetical protein [Pseudomonadota bacterium]
MTLATDLDGTYTVTSLTSYDGPLQKQSDGITTIAGGKTHRIDEVGCEWNSTFTWVADGQVKMTSVADPKNARKDFLLVGPNGLPTAEPQTYETILTVKRKEEKVQMTGTISYGRETIFLTMRKIQA